MEKRTPPEREAFSDEDSDEEDSDYEEIVMPMKKSVHNINSHIEN